MNLRKDHCRYRTEERPANRCCVLDRAREHLTLMGLASRRRGCALETRVVPADKQCQHGSCQGALRRGSSSHAFDGPRCGTGGEGRTQSLLKSKRLSATDISALASMKNVAKCDTWCELQNPANHQFFERKLRPKPFGRGHACLGVVNPLAPGHPARELAGMYARAQNMVSRGIGMHGMSRCGWPKIEHGGGGHHGVRWIE